MDIGFSSFRQTIIKSFLLVEDGEEKLVLGCGICSGGFGSSWKNVLMHGVMRNNVVVAIC